MSRKLRADAKAWVPSNSSTSVPDLMPPPPPPEYQWSSSEVAAPPQYGFLDERGEEIPPPPPDFVPNSALYDNGEEFSECFENWDDEVRRVHNDTQLRPQYETEDGALDGQIDPMTLWTSSLEVMKELIKEQLEEEAAYQRSVAEKYERLRQEKIAERKSQTKPAKKAEVIRSSKGSANKSTDKKPSQVKEKPLAASTKKVPLDTLTQALLSSASPFMAPLRQRCGTSLPHLKLDQRFGKKKSQDAVAQFIIAPIVANYKPRHLHEVTPGDLMEFHHDFALVLRVVKSATAICVNYGPEWKPHAIPYVYLTCSEYDKEVISLCPEEKPNSKSVPVYPDDVFKDVSTLILAIPELEVLQKQSFAKAMLKRTNLTPLYHVVNELFSPLGNYQLQIKDLTSTPSKFVLRCSSTLIRQISQPIIIAGDEDLWDQLPFEGDTGESAYVKQCEEENEVTPKAKIHDSPNLEHDNEAQSGEQQHEAPNRSPLIRSVALSAALVLVSVALVLASRRKRLN